MAQKFFINAYCAENIVCAFEDKFNCIINCSCHFSIQVLEEGQSWESPREPYEVKAR